MERPIAVAVDSGAYATAADFEQIFTEDMSGLYLLSFLLAGDRDKAEECFVAGIGESTKGNPVFKEWARLWVRRSIIQSAIRLIAPRQHSESAMRNFAVARTMDKLPLVLQTEVSAILELAPLERFVFVMSALERYSDHDYSILLGCARRDVTAARARALQQLGRLMNFQENEADAGSEDLAVHENPRPVIELTIARYFATPAWNRSWWGRETSYTW
jgi:DNA-directed RNA polymerase specialized sigma24 family protein